MEQKIPKKIHYCWFGGNPLPDLAVKCIESWKKYCPDYEIVEWNESNFDINCCAYVKEAYETKKWAFVSDVARLYALVQEGGVYMDTDVEVLRPLDDLLELEAFSGFESETWIPTGIMASQQGQTLFKELLDEYKSIHFKNVDGTLNLTTNVTRITNTCLNYGLVLNNKKQTICGFTLFSSEYFCPKSPKTFQLNVTKNSYTIHHFNGSWLSEEERYYVFLTKKYNKFMPNVIAGKLACFQSVKKYQGRKAAYARFFKWLKK